MRGGPRTCHLFDPAPVLAHYPGLTSREIADLLDVTRATVEAWRQGRRGIRATTADRLACKHIGIHPALLWPDTWWRT